MQAHVVVEQVGAGRPVALAVQPVPLVPPVLQVAPLEF